MAFHNVGSRIKRASRVLARGSLTLDMWHWHGIDSDVSVRRKAAFLISTLLLRTSEETDLPTSQFPGDAPVVKEELQTAALTRESLELKNSEQGSSVIDTIVGELLRLTPFGTDGNKSEDVELTEKLAKCVVMYLEAGGKLEERRALDLREALEGVGSDRMGLDGEEWKRLVAASEGKEVE
jgi:hypothetical protein